MVTWFQLFPGRLQSSTLLDQFFTLMWHQHKSRFPQDWLVSGRQPRYITVKTSVRKITSKTRKRLSLKFLFMKIGKAFPSQPLTFLIYCFSAENYPKMFLDISWWKPHLFKVEENVKSPYICEFLSQTGNILIAIVDQVLFVHVKNQL